MTVSLCMTASRDEASVRALLTLMRPAVDEIVLGVDSRAADRILGACADLVDRPYVYEFESTVEHHVAWLYHRCGGDWILRFDDDEVPSPELLRQLPDLAADRRRSAILMPIRNLFPTVDRFIASHPWHPDYRPRMVRNLPGLWTFKGSCHSVVETLGEQRRVPEAPVYHLHLAEPELAPRLAVAHARERLTPGLTTEAYPVNAFPVPELWTGVTTSEVPLEDRAMIAAVAAPEPVVTRVRAPAAPLISAFDAQRLLTDRAVPAETYRAEIDISPARRHLFAGTVAHLEVQVRNLGSEHWPPAHQDAPLIRLAYRWLAENGRTVLEPEGLRTPFEETVRPGDRTVAMLAVKTPETPGRYVLEVDVVHELVSWFDCCTRATMVVEALDGPAPGERTGLARPDMERIGFDRLDIPPPTPPAHATAADLRRSSSGRRSRLARASRWTKRQRNGPGASSPTAAGTVTAPRRSAEPSG